MSDKDAGVTGNAVNETRVTTPTLLSVPGTLPSGRPVAMSAQSKLSLLFSGGMVASWDIGVSALTRTSADDFDTNVFVKPNTPVSLHHSNSDLIVHVGNYLRSFSNTSMAQDNAVAAVGDDLVSYTFYRQEVTQPATPFIHWRWTDEWTETPYPWSLSRAQAIINHSIATHTTGTSADDPVWIYTGTSRREYDASTGGYTYTDSIPDLQQEWDLQYSPDPDASTVVIRLTYETNDWWRSRASDGTYSPWTPTGPAPWVEIVNGLAYSDSTADGASVKLTVPAARQDWNVFTKLLVEMYSFYDWGANGTLVSVGPTHRFVINRPTEGWHIQNTKNTTSGNLRGDHYLVYNIHYGLSVGWLEEKVVHFYAFPHAPTIIETALYGGTYAPIQVSMDLQFVVATGQAFTNICGFVYLYNHSGTYNRCRIRILGQ